MSYISPKEITANIRKELKAQFPTFKFSVTRKDYNSISVAIMKGDVDFGTEYSDVNHFWVKRDWEGQALKVLSKIVSICMSDNYITSEDSDYGSIPNYYVNLSIGKWDKPYENTNQEVVEETEEETPETSTEQVEETNPVQVKEITVLWHEGNIEDRFEGTYESFEEFNETVMEQGFWKDHRGAKISLMITFTNQDNYRLRYDVENYEGNGSVDLRERVLTYINHSKGQDWFDLQKALSSEEEAIETRKQLALIEQYIHNTPVKSVEEAVKSVNLHTTPKEPTPAQRNEIIATLTYQSQIAAIKLVVKILQVRLEEALELVSKLSREIEPSQA